VEDDEEFAAFLAAMLASQRLGGRRFVMFHVSRLSAARREVLAGNVDAVLMDLGLPDSQGPETLYELHRANPYVPYVVVSGRHDPGLRALLLQAGAQDVLRKAELDASRLVHCLGSALHWRREAARGRTPGSVVEAAPEDWGGLAMWDDLTDPQMEPVLDADGNPLQGSDHTPQLLQPRMRTKEMARPDVRPVARTPAVKPDSGSRWLGFAVAVLLGIGLGGAASVYLTDTIQPSPREGERPLLPQNSAILVQPAAPGSLEDQVDDGGELKNTPSLSGTWRGTVGARPFTLRVQSSSSSVEGHAELREDGELRSTPVSGSVGTSGQVRLEGQGMVLEGQLVGRSLEGSYDDGTRVYRWQVVRL